MLIDTKSAFDCDFLSKKITFIEKIIFHIFG